MVGLLFLAVSVLVGHDLDLHADIDAGGHGYLSPRIVGVFLTGFGAVGAVASLYLPAREGRALIASFLGVLSGIVLSGIYLVAMRLIHSQEASSLVGDQDLVGIEGRVTVAIPADGVGEVTCPIGGQTTRRMARTFGSRAIAEGAVVRIKDVYGATVVVEPVP
ncbi:MAG TPA: NfeD family protein [Methylomirabilota bacterium]|nr:NfeD family protein [Methylomirabilota bacterium]